MTLDPRILAPLLAGVLESPADDGPRLAYADTLDDFGDGQGDALRAEFIRVQCEVAGFKTLEGPHGAGVVPRKCKHRWCALRHRERDLLLGGLPDLPNYAAWTCTELRPFCPVALLPDNTIALTGLGRPRIGELGHALGVRFGRGFIEHLLLPADVLPPILEAVREVAPIREVTLTTEPDFDFLAGFYFDPSVSDPKAVLRHECWPRLIFHNLTSPCLTGTRL